MEAMTINKLIKDSIEKNKYSKSLIARKAGMSEKKLRRILNADDIDISSLFSICNAVGTKVILEFTNGIDLPLRLPLINLTDEQTQQSA